MTADPKPTDASNIWRETSDASGYVHPPVSKPTEREALSVDQVGMAAAVYSKASGQPVDGSHMRAALEAARTVAPPHPVAYALQNKETGEVEVARGLFRRREAAEVAALRLTNQWKTIGVLPLQIALED